MVYALLVVDHLRIDVVQRAIHVQPRPLTGAGQLGADARVNPLANFVSLVHIHRLFPISGADLRPRSG